MRKTIKILIVASILFVFSATVLAQKATRVKFRKGATSATVSGTLASYKSKRFFVIRLRAGQTLRTEQIKSDSSTRYITVVVKNPRGKIVGDSDASCNNDKEVAPTQAGDYRIEVVECQKADAWRGSFKLKVSVK